MERRNINVRLLMLTIVVLGLLAKQSSAAFGQCYGACFIFCLLKPNETVCTCTLQCLKDCLIPSSLPASIDNPSSSPLTDQYCNLGCAIFSCATISSKNNPGVKEVASCVNSCSQICTKNH